MIRYNISEIPVYYMKYLKRKKSFRRNGRYKF